MNINDVIVQLRVAAPVFCGNVAGAATYANAVADQVWLPRPACYVVPLHMDAGENTSQNALWQQVSMNLGVIVDLDNTADRRGQATAADVTDFFFAICRAILNWRPDWNPATPSTNRETRGIRFVGGEVILNDRARLQYQFSFALDIVISDLDGWQPPSTPLLNITGQLVNPTTQAPVVNVGFDADLPQS